MYIQLVAVLESIDEKKLLGEVCEGNSAHLRQIQSVVDVSSLGFGEAPWPKGQRDAPSEAGVP